MKTIEKSRELFEKAKTLAPGGVHSPVRAFGSVGGTPVFFARGKGGHCIDADGNDYLDFCQSWGPLILGHADETVVDAVRKAAVDGLSFGACHDKEVALAESVLRAFPTYDRVRFVSSGTEAVMTAIRLARGITGRSRIVKFEGGYHGHSDSLLVKAGSGLATSGVSSSGGVPDELAGLTLVLPLDDDEALEAAFEKFGSEIACAVIEPLPGNNGLLEQRPEWLEKLRALTKTHGSLLIFDEVISGFRLRFGGYGDSLGIQADLVTLGKIIGGGMPVGAVVGPKDHMENLAPLGKVYQAGTLSGNPVAMAAGKATLDQLEDGSVYTHLENLGKVFDETLEAAKSDLPFLNWRRLGSLIWVYFEEGEVPRRADKIPSRPIERFNAIYHEMLQAGYYLPPSGYELWFLCRSHTADEIRSLAQTVCGKLKALG